MKKGKRAKKAEHTHKNHHQSVLPLEVIAEAAAGDVGSIEKILTHFGGYLTALATRTFYDENGSPHMFVDGEKRRRLEIKLITGILKYPIVS